MDPLIKSQLLYQLSYAPTGLPSRVKGLLAVTPLADKGILHFYENFLLLQQPQQAIELFERTVVDPDAAAPAIKTDLDLQPQPGCKITFQ